MNETIQDILYTGGRNDLDFAGRVDELAKAMLQHPQVECSVVHRFGPGLYIREVTIPAGTLAVGHHQKHEHMNVMLQGKVTILNEDGTAKVLEAPTVFVGKPGRKIGYIHEDVVWQNIYATEERDVEKLEQMFLEKAQSWNDHLAMQRLAALPLIEDREDYQALLDELGVTEAEVRAETERQDTMIDLPYGSYKIKLGDSPIEGKGLFATANIDEGELIAPARINGKRTIAGRYTNHARHPNAVPERVGNMVFLVARRPIKGCHGGHDGEEITINYRDALKITAEFNQEAMSCQECGQQSPQ